MNKVKLNYNTFKKGFKNVCETWNRVCTDSLAKVYYSALQDLSDEEFVYAYGCVILNCKDFAIPKPAMFRQYIDVTHEDRSKLAFGKYRSAVTSHGGYVSVVFQDKLIHAVVKDFGGWWACCNMPDADWKYHKPDWIKQYLLYLVHPPDYIQEKLYGLTDTQNIAKGYEEDKTCAMIGFEEVKRIEKT